MMLTNDSLMVVSDGCVVFFMVELGLDEMFFFSYGGSFF